MTCGVYEIKNTKNGHRYVGSSVNVEKRWSTHIAVLVRKKHHSAALQRAWNKYGAGRFVFKILRQCEIELLASVEQSEMTLGAAYNCMPRARSSRGFRHTPRTRERMRMAAILIAAEPTERKRRSIRAKAQHAAGKLGRATWNGAAAASVVEASRLSATECRLWESAYTKKTRQQVWTKARRKAAGDRARLQPRHGWTVAQRRKASESAKSRARRT